MHFLLVDQNGKVTGHFDTNDLDCVPANAVNASVLTEWQRSNTDFLTWNGTAWLIDASLPVQPIPETSTAKAARLKTFLQNNGFTATQSTTLITVLKELIAQLN